MGPAAIRARDLHVGNSAFKAWADVRWTGAEPPVPAGDFNAYVWIGIDGPDSTVEIGGVTVIREPILAYGPEAEFETLRPTYLAVCRSVGR